MKSEIQRQIKEMEQNMEHARQARYNMEQMTVEMQRKREDVEITTDEKRTEEVPFEKVKQEIEKVKERVQKFGMILREKCWRSGPGFRKRKERLGKKDRKN
uniref:Uncharacterized protein n=1 Tax=Anguilla anguilla TaxID=7936 RepID=A0A0E9SCP6_ANGAN